MHVSHHNTPWTAERIALLTELWDAGESAGIIANEMGISRNAVIGKVARLGLRWRRTTNGLAIRQFPEAQKGPRRHPLTRNAIGRQVRPVKYTIIEEPQPKDAVTLLGLSSRNCHWPLWHADEAVKLYCGAPVIEGKSYCSFHCRMAYSYRPGLTTGEREQHRRDLRKIYATLMVRAA